MPDPKIERRKIVDLTPDPSNANLGSERGLRMLDDSLSEVGLGRGIVADKNGVVLGGNKTLDRAVDRGFEDAIFVHTTGDQLVVTVRDDLDAGALDDPRARKLALYDNRVAEVDLAWSAEQLLADLNAGTDLSALWREDELDALLASVRTPDFGPGSEGDQARLDEKNAITCPHCGERFIPT